MGTSGLEELTVQFSEYPTLHKYEEQEPYHPDILDFTGTLHRTPTNQSDFTTPSRFNFFPATSTSNIAITTISDLISVDGSLNNHLFNTSPVQGPASWWLDITNPTSSEIHLISTAFSLHPLTEQDIKMSEARERIELFKDYYYICFHSFYHLDDGDIKDFNAHIIVFPGGTLSFIFHDNSRHSYNVRTRMARLRDYMTFTSDWICYAIIDDIIDNFTHLTTSIDQETNTLEDEVSVSRTTDSDTLLLQIHLCRQKVMSTTRLLTQKSSIIKTLIKIHNLIPASTTARDDFNLYLSDIQDHVITMISNLKHFDEVLLRSRASYLAQISVERIKTKNQIFQLISKCATISAILVSVNIICGLFGMNVRVPGQKTEGVSWWLGIAGVVVASMLVSTIMAKRKKLI